MPDLFDAIFGYYMVTLGAGAFSGVRASLRPAHPAPATATPGPGSPDTDLTGADGSAPFARGHRLGRRAVRRARAARRDGTAASVAGWVSGVRVYRAGRAGGRSAGLAYTRRTARSRPDMTGPDAVEPTPRATAPEPGPSPDRPTATAPPSSGPESGVIDWTDAELVDDTDDPGDDTYAVAEPLDHDLDGAPTPGPRHLTLVPPLKEYPPMPSADITDLESLVGFTGQAAAFAGMESEDALAASASTIAAAEFAGETARRIEDETGAVEMAIATMAVLNVDAETSAAYHRLHEAGGAYQELANAFAAGCQDLAAIAANMSTAASGYHEAAVAALDTVNTHQMPHAEAAMATGHGGADGQFYGVASTQNMALPTVTVGALPAGD